MQYPIEKTSLLKRLCLILIPPLFNPSYKSELINNSLPLTTPFCNLLLIKL